MGVDERRPARPKRAAALADEERRLELRVAHYWRFNNPEDFRALPDDVQDEMTAYVTEVCPECGNLRSVCSDPERSFYPQRRMCYASAAQALTIRRLQAKHKGEPGTVELHPLDGMGVYASPDDLTPDDNFI